MTAYDDVILAAQRFDRGHTIDTHNLAQRCATTAARSSRVRARVASSIHYHWTCLCGTTLTGHGDHTAFVQRVLDHTDHCIESDQGDA